VSWASHTPILLSCIFLSAYFSGVETGAYCVNRLRLRYRTEKRERPARILTGLLDRIDLLVPTVLIGTNLASYVATGVVTKMLESEWKTTVALTPILFIFGEVLPKEIFRSRADTLAYQAARSVKAFTWLFYPVSLGLRGVIRLMSRLTGEEGTLHTLDVSPARLRFTFAQGAEAGVLTAYQDEIVRNVIGLRDVRVRNVRIPLKEVVVADNATTPEGLVELAREVGYSRIPIWQGRRHNIVGVVHLFDVLAEDRPGVTIRNYLRDVPRISPNASIYQALDTLQSSHIPMGVVEQDGRAVGIVTVTDLVETIVGELED
jgi:CBS domain containing-hemolysin-like protein